MIAAMIVAGPLVAALPVAAPARAATSTSTESVEFFRDAQKQLHKGDVNAAVIQLKNALQKDPDNIEARRLLGNIYLSLGNGPAAEKELKAALRRMPTADKTLMIQIGRAYLLQRKYEQVLKELTDDVTNPDIRVNVLLVRGRALLGRGRLEQGRKVFEEAEKLKPKSAEPKIGIAQALINQGKIDAADAKTKEALAIAPDKPSVLILKGEIARLRRDHSTAVKAFSRVIQLSRHNISAHLGRAATLIDENKDSEAEADLRAVFRRSPRNPLASYLSALIRFRKHDFRGAQEAIQNGGPALDDHMPSQFLKGATHYALNQLEQAEQTLTHYLDVVPGSVRARVLLGATLLRSKQYAKAIKTLKPLQGTKNETAQVMSLLGSSYMRLGKYAESAALFEKAAKAAPNAASIRTQLALSRLATGASNEAIDDLRAAVDLDPESRQAGILLALVQLRKGNFDAAMTAARRLRKAMPNNPLPLNLIGAAQIGKGRIKEARKTFEEVLKTHPTFHPARMNLAQIDLREHNYDGARAQYAAIIDNDKSHLGALMGMADLAALQGRNDEVVGWLRRAIEANPKNVTASLKLVEHYLRRRDFKSALTAAREAQAEAKNNPQVIEAVGRAELANSEPVAAVSTFRKLVGVVPRSPRSYQLLAAAQVAAKDISDARESYRKAIDLDVDPIPSYRALAEFETRQGNEKAALNAAAALERKLPKSPAGRMLAGDIYQQEHKYDAALAAYRDARRKEDTAALALRIHRTLTLAGRTGEALSGLQRWVDRKNDMAVRHVLATAYIDAKRYPDAVRESEKLLAKEPDNPVVLNNLAWLYSQKRDPRDLDYAEKALKQAPASPAIQDTLGWILVGRGQTGRAARLLKEAHEAAPRSGDIAYHYAVVLDKTGRRAEARRILQGVLDPKANFAEANNARKLLSKLGG